LLSGLELKPEFILNSCIGALAALVLIGDMWPNIDHFESERENLQKVIDYLELYEEYPPEEYFNY